MRGWNTQKMILRQVLDHEDLDTKSSKQFAKILIKGKIGKLHFKYEFRFSLFQINLNAFVNFNFR